MHKCAFKFNVHILEDIVFVASCFPLHINLLLLSLLCFSVRCIFLCVTSFFVAFSHVASYFVASFFCCIFLFIASFFVYFRYKYFKSVSLLVDIWVRVETHLSRRRIFTRISWNSSRLRDPLIKKLRDYLGIFPI